jgi:hypothetical protein
MADSVPLSVTKLYDLLNSGLYYKYIMIVNNDSSVVNKFGASLTDATRVIIYDGWPYVNSTGQRCQLHEHGPAYFGRAVSYLC